MGYFEQEIDIRVESIIDDVREFGEKLKNKLNEMKKNVSR